jgi:hypothetical protein
MFKSCARHFHNVCIILHTLGRASNRKAKAQNTALYPLLLPLVVVLFLFLVEIICLAPD